MCISLLCYTHHQSCHRSDTLDTYNITLSSVVGKYQALSDHDLAVSIVEAVLWDFKVKLKVLVSTSRSLELTK